VGLGVEEQRLLILFGRWCCCCCCCCCRYRFVAVVVFWFALATGFRHHTIRVVADEGDQVQGVPVDESLRARGRLVDDLPAFGFAIGRRVVAILFHVIAIARNRCHLIDLVQRDHSFLSLPVATI